MTITQGFLGSVVQVVYSEYLTNANIASPGIPIDDTIPQITEGTEILTATITPKSLTNKLVVRFQGFGACGTADVHLAAALFRDAGANALAGSIVTADKANYLLTFHLEYQETAPSTSAITYRIRVAADTVGGPYTIRMNGNTATRYFGGIARSSLVVQEIVA